MKLILYSKPGCHLCEGLEEKLRSIDTVEIQLEIRDILTREDWFAQYQYEIPVLFWQVDGSDRLIPRPSPRANTAQLTRLLQNTLDSLS